MIKPEYTEPEENASENRTDNTTGATPKVEKDPLTEEDTIERPHTKIPGAAGNQPMPEFKINPSLVSEQPGPEGPQPGGAPEDEEIPPYDEIKKQQQNMTPEQEKEAAMFTANFLLDGYGDVWKELGNLVMPISERRVKNLVKEGALVLEMPINYNGKIISAEQLIGLFNNESYNKLGLDQKTKDKIAPIIAEELARRGMVMSPMMYVIVVLVKHGVSQIKIIMKCLKKKDEFINSLKETSEIFKQYGRPDITQAPPQQQQQTHQPQDSMPTNEPANTENNQSTFGVETAEERTARVFRQIQRQNRNNPAGKIPAVKGKSPRKHRVKSEKSPGTVREKSGKKKETVAN